MDIPHFLIEYKDLQKCKQILQDKAERLYGQEPGSDKAEIYNKVIKFAAKLTENKPIPLGSAELVYARLETNTATKMLRFILDELEVDYVTFID